MARRIPEHKVEEIYQAADVVEILGDYLQMKKRGSNYFALSPFANEKTPSFAISPSKNIWKDFSSGKGGNAVTFLMEAEGMTYVEALKHIAEKYNIDLEMEETPEDFAREDRRDSLYILNEFAAKFFHEQMLETDGGRRIGLSYFKERGILETTIETFQLGYAPDEWELFTKAALKQQFKEEFLEATGLAFRSEKQNKLLDRFKGRIMFPIHNHLGKVVGFGGRILGNKEKMAKYINSPESEVYHKSNILYGLYHGKSAIRDLDRCLLVEGYMDVIALYQAGIKNVVASSGTALTPEQIKLIKRFSKNVLLIYDSDRAGVNAALRGVDLLLEQEMAVRVLLLPEGEDPDSYVKEHGKSGFDAFVEERAVDFIDFKIECLARELDFSDPQQKTQAIHETAQTLARIPDQVKLAVYLGTAAERLRIDQEVMKRSLNRALADRARLESRQRGFKERQSQLAMEVGAQPDQPSDKQAPAEISESYSREAEVVRIMVNYANETVNQDGDDIPLMDVFVAAIAEIEFVSAAYEKLKNEMCNMYRQNGKVDVQHFLNHGDKDISGAASRMLTIPYEVSKNWEKYDIRAPSMDEDIELSVISALEHYRYSHFEKLMNDARKKIREFEGKKEQDKYTKQYMKAKQLHTEIATSLGIVVLRT